MPSNPMRFDPMPAARHLQRMRQQHAIVTPLPTAIAPSDVTQGAAVQRALAELVGSAVPYGFKIGATGQRMQEYLGVSTPIAGFMREADVYHASADLTFADTINPGVECEVAVRLAKDMPPGPCTLAQALDAVGEFFAGIELVENRYAELSTIGTPTLVADQMYHVAAVIGDQPVTSWRDLDIGALRGTITVDNGATDSGTTADLLGHPLNGLAWLAGSAVAAAFGGLRAGQVIMLGSVTPPIWLNGPARVTVNVPPLPLVQLRLR